MKSPPLPNQPPQPRRSQTGKWLGIGCLAALAILIVIIVIGYYGVKSFVGGLVNKWTDAQPRNLPQLNMPEAQAREVCARASAFWTAVRENRPTAPLLLSGDDLNALIKYEPDWSELAGKVYITINGDKIRGEISLPLEIILPMFKGRYLNGSGVWAVQLVQGRLFIFLEKIEVKGKDVPEDFMKDFRTKNLAEDVNKNEKNTAALSRLESITVQNGQLRIVPKPAQ
jgi:hypothetical protein